MEKLPPVELTTVLQPFTWIEAPANGVPATARLLVRLPLVFTYPCCVCPTTVSAAKMQISVNMTFLISCLSFNQLETPTIDVQI